MPISAGEYFLQAFDKAADDMRRSVLQIIGIDTSGRPGAVGSGVLFEINGVRLLVTAAHVVSEWEPVSTLYLPGESGLVEIDGVDFLSEATCDVAVAILPEALIRELSGFRFLPESNCTSLSLLQPAYLGAIGYPASRNAAQWRRPVIANRPYLVGGMPKGGSSPNVTFRYSKGKNRTSRVRQKFIGPDLWGMSGGGMFAARVGLSPRLFLVGISTDWQWSKTQVVGCGWPFVLQVIRRVIKQTSS